MRGVVHGAEAELRLSEEELVELYEGLLRAVDIQYSEVVMYMIAELEELIDVMAEGE